MTETPETTTCRIATATSTDATAAYALVRDLGYDRLEAAAFRAAFEAVLADRAQTVWLAERDGQVLGLMSLSRRPQLRLGGLIMTVDEMVVAEQARGTGVGRRLLQLAKTEATRAGARRLELLTGRGRPSYDRGFYVKNGFEEMDSAVMRWSGM
jgi:N-acetylglutamate synthase-like GNAT family acetyltransferase